MSVNLDELDYLDQKILTNDNSGNVFIRNLSNSNALNRRFGFSVDSHGVVHLEDNKSKDDLDKEEDINAMISEEIDKLKAGKLIDDVAEAIGIEKKPELTDKNITEYFGRRDGMIII